MLTDHRITFMFVTITVQCSMPIQLFAYFYVDVISGDRAGATYVKLANCHLKVSVGILDAVLFFFPNYLWPIFHEELRRIFFINSSWTANMRRRKLMLMLLIATRKFL